MPGNPADKMDNKTYPILTKVGSKSKYSARPPQIPEIILLSDLSSFLGELIVIFLC